jgi:hypothetical protein
MLNGHEGKKDPDGFNGDWPWYVVIAVKRIIHFLEVVGRSVERGHGTFGFMVPEDTCSPGSPAGVNAVPAPVDTGSMSRRTGFRKD